MNPFTFALKRAWWCMVRMLTKLIQMAWCTPARLELLLAIEQRPGRNNPDKRHIDRGLISLILSIEEGAG